MRKNFYLSGLFLCILALCVCGCGGGGGSAADPMGTGTVQFVDGSGSIITSATAVPNGTITLIARVSNLRSDGTSVPVVNEKVSFSMVTTSSGGGSLSVVNDRTASGGLAMVVYTAGNNMFSDIVRVTTEVGATATITINKSGGTADSRIATLSLSTSDVVAGQTSVVTAKVTDGASNPIMGEIVLFTLPVNGSGASFSNAGVSVSSIFVPTDASGNAVAVYKAGSNNPLTVVYDTVRGELWNGSSNAVVITRSAGTAPTDLSVSVAAAPTSVSAGQTSIITATVTGDDKAGASVTFTLPVNASGASFINASGSSVASIMVTASGSGIATAIYRAGSNSSFAAVYDTVRATLANGVSNAVVITRSGGTDLSVSVAADPTSVSAGQTSIITATVTGDDKVGAAVIFTLPVNDSGACFINAANVCVAGVVVNANASGIAVAIYRGGSTSPNVNVYDTVRATLANGFSNAVVITRNAGTDLSVSVDAAPTSVSAGQTSIITATVTGDNKAGAAVTFTLPVNASGASFINASGSGVDSIMVTASGSGIATAIYRAGSNSSFTAVYDTVRGALANGSSNSVVITRNAWTDMSVSVAAAPTSVSAGQASIITATVTGDDKAGAAVTFTLPVNQSGASFINAAGVYVSSVSVNTDPSGNAVAIYLSGNNNSLADVYDTVRGALANGSSSAVQIKRSAGTVPPPPTALSVLVAAAPTSVSDGQTSIITATVTGDQKSGAAVTFTLPANFSGASFINAGGASVASITVTASGSGIATAIYRAGSLSPGAAVQDTVQAVLTNGANAAVILTRTASMPSTYTVAIAASPASVTAGQVSIITATVTSTSGSAAGVSVIFTLPVDNSNSTLKTDSVTGKTVTAMTDGTGKAVVVYQPGTTSPTLSVQDTVQAAVGSATSAVAITRVGSATSAFRITVKAEPATLSTPTSNSVVTANVLNNLGTAVSGVPVTFTSSGSAGSVPAGSTAITDGSGNAVVIYTGAGAAKATGVVTASITIDVNIYTAAVVITNP
jgi:hypothetical protein